MKHYRTRFAPSPTGYLHHGHFHAATIARQWGNECVMRIEDLDQTRARPQFTQAIIDDCESLGLKFDEIIPTIQPRIPIYKEFFEKLQKNGLVYPCFCSKREIETTIQNAPHHYNTQTYPHICTHLSPAEISEKYQQNPTPAWRFNSKKAKELYKNEYFTEISVGDILCNPTALGDQILQNRLGQFAYHLAVVVDDYIDKITLITRGDDLLPATGLQRLINTALGLPRAQYHHHGLIRDKNGVRLSKHAISPRIVKKS